MNAEDTEDAQGTQRSTVLCDLRETSAPSAFAN